MIYRAMYCGMIKLAFIILFINFALPDAGADEMTLEHLQEMYTNITPGYELCYFYGTYCIRGQEFCSTEEKTCKSLFPNDATEETKLATCKDVIRRNETKPGVYDNCIYFFGKLEIRRGFGKHTEDHPHDPHPMRAPGKELCRHPDTFCQLGSEFCNNTSGNCGPLFLPNASDTEKRQRCEQVIRNNITMLEDACTYALGKMSCPESNVTEKKTVEQGNHTNVWGITATVITVVLVIVIVAMIAFVFIKCKKLLWFKETQTPPAQDVPINAVNEAAEGDLAMRAQEQRALLENKENDERAELD